uniref:DUF4371 domain-containing protein n=1 Tax=Sinocyclocheilus anshuiensis TaxID=1608454 RepID=A0A671RCV7_9TELE
MFFPHYSEVRYIAYFQTDVGCLVGIQSQLTVNSKMRWWLLGKRGVEDDNPSSSTGPNCTSSKRKTRKYSDEYLSFGFTSVGPADNPTPVCVLCSETLSNEALKPYYQQRKKVIKSTCVTGGENEKAVTASYEVSRLIATSGKPHTIGEDLILPAAKQMVSIMLGNNVVYLLNSISLSNNTVKRRINDMAENVFQQLICRVRASHIAGMANFLAFVRYECDREIEENFLFCRPLHSNATAEAIFEILNDFIISNDINWTKCVGLHTDGARAMLGRHSGVVKRVRDVAPRLTRVHCCIHREALAAKRMPMDLKTVLDNAVRMVNYIKSRPLQAHLFSLLCEEMGSEHRQLFLHTEVRWLSRGRVLTRPFQLHCLCDFDWLCKLAYLADIFSHLNGLNLALQGTAVTMFHVHNKIEFWLHVSNEYPELANKAIMFLMPFATMYMCEVGFSVLVALKTKYRNVLSVESDL